MGIQTMNSHMGSGGQQSHLQQHPLPRHNSWLRLTLDQVKAHVSSLGKPLGIMTVDELLKHVWASEATRSDATINNSPEASLQRQASWSLARAFSGKTVDEVWWDIQQGYKTERIGRQERELTLGETTLEDFLVKAGMYVTSPAIEPMMSLDSALKSHKMRLSPSPPSDAILDIPMPSRKRMSGDVEKAIDRRLRRKIKNRESAARSRARKQAYHNELVTKVSLLEEDNTKLKKEKEFEEMVSSDVCEQRYQLRRTSSL